MLDVDTLSCNDVHCRDDSHLHKLEGMSNDLITSISSSVNQNIPLCSNAKPFKVIPGWSLFLHLKTSLFSGNIWISAGLPVDTNLHRIMKSTRNRYRYAIRKIQRLKHEIQKSKFLQSCIDGNINDVFCEIKRIRNKHSTNSSVIDGYSTDLGITDNFKRIYSDIYNVHDDGAKLQKILSRPY